MLLGVRMVFLGVRKVLLGVRKVLGLVILGVRNVVLGVSIVSNVHQVIVLISSPSIQCIGLSGSIENPLKS